MKPRGSIKLPVASRHSRTGRNTSPALTHYQVLRSGREAGDTRDIGGESVKTLNELHPAGGALEEGRSLIRDRGDVANQQQRLAWLELKPVTGRKHQIRLHCAHALGSPVLGDVEYGGRDARLHAMHAVRLNDQQRGPGKGGDGVVDGGVEADGVTLGRDSHGDKRLCPQAVVDKGLHADAVIDPNALFLHCRSLGISCIREGRRGQQGSTTTVTAPLPLHWQALFRQQGWPVPDDVE